MRLLKTLESSLSEYHFILIGVDGISFPFQGFIVQKREQKPSSNVKEDGSHNELLTYVYTSLA